MSVQGVGAKVALAIQGVLSGAELSQAVAAEDKAMVARAPGVGPKVAQRIVTELKDKVPEAQFAVATPQGDVSEVSKALGEALSALTNLGYPRAQANAGLMAARAKLDDEESSVEALIKQALKELV
jgi:Holliday junction DNA helicase RuvA